MKAASHISMKNMDYSIKVLEETFTSFFENLDVEKAFLSMAQT